MHGQVNVLRVLVCSWMCDFGEYVPFDAVLGDPNSTDDHDPAQVHNLFPQLWAQTAREAVDDVTQSNDGSDNASEDDQVVFFSRSAAGQSPKYSPLFWMGTYSA